MSKIEHDRIEASVKLLDVKYCALGLLLAVLLGCSSPGGAPERTSVAGSGGSSAGSSNGGAAGSMVSGGSSSGGTAGSSSSAGSGGTTIGGAGGSASGGSAGASGSSGGGGGSAGATTSCTPSSGTEELTGGVLLDKATCLMWESEPGFIAGGNWEPSKTYCENLSLGGFDDWRMPTVLELGSTPVAYIGRLCTDPRYVPDGATDLGDFHYCGVTHWDPNQPLGCGWVGPGNMDGTICVRGTTGVALSAPSGCDCDSGRAGYMPYAD